MSINNAISVIGLGNRFRQDDGVGLEAAEIIRNKQKSNIKVVNNISENTGLIESWTNTCGVFIVDAVSSGSTVGKIHRFEPLREKIPAGIFHNYSTHALNLIQALELAKILDKLPDSLVVYGIEGKNYSPGVGLSPEVRKASLKVSENILKEISDVLKDRIRK